MFKLRYFLKSMCRHADYGGPTTFTIWNVKAYTARAIYDFFTAVSPCRPDLFPLIYWTVLFASALGFALSVFEFLTIYQGSKNLSTFRDRRFKVLPFTIRRNARLIGSAFMAKANLLLFIGVSTASPKSMVPWLTVQTICFVIEIVIWFFDILSNEDSLTFSHAISYVLFICLWWITVCIKDVFENAADGIDIDQISLISKCSGSCRQF